MRFNHRRSPFGLLDIVLCVFVFIKRFPLIFHLSIIITHWRLKSSRWLDLNPLPVFFNREDTRRHAKKKITENFSLGRFRYSFFFVTLCVTLWLKLGGGFGWTLINPGETSDGFQVSRLREKV